MKPKRIILILIAACIAAGFFTGASGLLSYYQRIHYYHPVEIHMSTHDSVVYISATGITPNGNEIPFRIESGTLNYGYRFFSKIILTAENPDYSDSIFVSINGNLFRYCISDLPEANGRKNSRILPEETHERRNFSGMIKSFVLSDLTTHLVKKSLIVLLYFGVSFSIAMMGFFSYRRFRNKKNNGLRIRAVFSLKHLPLLFILPVLPYLIVCHVAGIDPRIYYDMSRMLFFTATYIFWFLIIFLTLWQRQLQGNIYAILTFVLICFALYFFWSPSSYVGSFRFSGSVSEYYAEALRSGWQSIFIKDTGYFVLPQRIFYFLITSFGLLSPYAPQLSGFAAAAFIAAFFIFFISEKFSGIISDVRLRTAIVLLLGLFSCFVMQVSPEQEIILTDVVYYGVIFSLLAPFIAPKHQKASVIIWMALLNVLLILSKPHFLSFIPLYTGAAIIFFVKGNRLMFTFILVSLVAMAIQAGGVWGSMRDIESLFDQARSTGINTTLNFKEMGFASWLFSSLIYYIRSVQYFVSLGIETSPVISAIINIITFTGIVFLLIRAIKLAYKKADSHSLFFVGAHITAFLAAMLFLKTAADPMLSPSGTPLYQMSFPELFTDGRIQPVFHRYTLFVQLPIALSLLVLLFNTASEFHSKKTIPLIIVFILSVNIVFHLQLPASGFWGKTKNNKWAYECRQLMEVMKNEKYFIPLHGFPAKKMHQSSGMELLGNTDPSGEDTLMLSDFIPNNALPGVVIGLLPPVPDNKLSEVRLLLLNSNKNPFALITPLYRPAAGRNYLYFNFDLMKNAGFLVFIDKSGKTIRFPGRVFIAGATAKR
jgi:hypothetical protein